MVESTYTVRTFKDYPKEGINLPDTSSLWKDATSHRKHIDDLAAALEGVKFDKIIGLESGGFAVGGALAYKLGKAFIPIRKKGKLPTEKYTTEILDGGKMETFEIHKDGVDKGEKVIIVDDLLGDGNTTLAALELAKKLEAEVVAAVYIFELTSLKGREALKDIKVITLKSYE